MVMGNPVRKFTDYNNQDEQKSKRILTVVVVSF